MIKQKYYILGTLALLCLLGTGYYVWTLYDSHRKQVAEWNEGAKAAFEEALWMEVDKRAEIPMYSYSSGEEGMTTFKEKIPDSVSVMTMNGWKKYKIDRDKYGNSLIKETMRRGNLSGLLEIYPLSIDTLLIKWNSLLSKKHIYVRNQIRYIHTDLNLDNDTVFSVVDKRLPHLDSLTVKYLGFRCEHELAAYVYHTSWLFAITYIDRCLLLLPWLLLVLLFICYPKLEIWVRRKMTNEKIIEKTVEIEKEVIVEKKIHLTDVTMDKAQIFELPDGTIFDAFAGILEKDGLQQRLQPQSVSLLKLFLKEKNHQVSSDNICLKLWGDVSHTERLYSAIRRLRNDLKKVKSELFIESSYGVYELKSPISSQKSDQC